MDSFGARFSIHATGSWADSTNGGTMTKKCRDKELTRKQ
jgi:hypothetical protein